MLMPLAVASRNPAPPQASTQLALQISDNDPAKMNAVLNVAANVSKYYSDKGEEVEIQIVAFNAGLNMLRDDKSPVKPRLKSFKAGHAERLVHGLREHTRGHDPQAKARSRHWSRMPSA